MSKTYKRNTRNNHWHGKPRCYPRHKMDNFEGTNAAMRFRVGESRYNLNCCDNGLWYNGYSWIDNFVDKHLGEKWNILQSRIINRLKNEGLPLNEIRRIIDNHILNLDYKWLHPMDKYLINEEGLIIKNPNYEEYRGYYRNRTQGLYKDYVRFNKRQLKSIKPIQVRDSYGRFIDAHDNKAVCEAFICESGHVIKVTLYNRFNQYQYPGVYKEVYANMLGLPWKSKLFTVSSLGETSIPVTTRNNKNEPIYQFINGKQQYTKKVIEYSYGKLRLYAKVSEIAERLAEISQSSQRS